MTTIFWILILIIVILTVYNIITYSKFLKLKNENLQNTQEYSKLLSQKKSSEVRLGQISEQLAPFLDGFPYDPKNIKFLGQPIDFVCFEDDKVVFLEVKSGQSQLSPKQSNIKNLIKSKQVFWEEFRISGKPDTKINKSDEGKTVI